MMENCTVEGCFINRPEGDNLFCINCRKSWRQYCDLLGINEVDIEKEYLAVTLKKFQENAIRGDLSG